MKINYINFVFVSVLFIASCKSNNHKYVIIGNITGMPEETIVLEQLNANGINTIIDSVHSDKVGHFEFTESTSEPGLFRLHFRYNKYVLLSLDKESVKVIADWNNIEKYNVTGSEASENLKKLLVAYREKMSEYRTLSILIDTLKARGNDSIIKVAQKDLEELNFKFTRYIENYADTTPYLPNAVFAARILNPLNEITYLDQFTQNINRRFPGTKMAKDFAEYFLKINARPAKVRSIVANVNIGEVVPEINLPSNTGNWVSLSSMRGKYILLDFWASFCPPCRAENPNIVAIYSKFKDKNFTVYGVSLDDNKEAWEKAIKDDKLDWTQVSDLKRWESPIAKLFGIESIPSNFLIDPNGKILAKNIQGEELENMLAKLMK